MDEAAALRSLARRLSAQLELRNPLGTPMAVPRGAPRVEPVRGQLPQPEPVDCADGQAPPRFKLRSGPTRQGPMLRRPRKVVTYMFPRLRGGMQVEDGELLTGLRSLRGALARGLVPQIDQLSARRPLMTAGPPAPPTPSTAAGWDPAEVFKPGLIDPPSLSAPSVRLRYRSTFIELPSDWVMPYLAAYIETRGSVTHDSVDGIVSGAGVVLDAYWPRFRARVMSLPRRRIAYGRLIGCWMLPYTAEEGMPLSLFFQTAGEQRAVHDLTCQLLHAYIDEARVPTDTRTGRKLVDDDGWCDGLSAFIQGVLEGGAVAALRQGNDVAEPALDLGSFCRTSQIHYTNKNADGIHGAELWLRPCTVGRYSGDVDAIRCDDISKECRSMKTDDLLDWNDYVVELREVAFDPVLGRAMPYAWLSDTARSSSSSSAWPAGDASVAACNLGGLRSLQLTPAHVAFDGELLDLLMFMAQLCLDYCRSMIRGARVRSATPSVGEAWRAGTAFAGYALRIVAGRASLLVHEFGHMYLGGTPHAGFQPVHGRPRWRACFDIARRTVLARIVTENGLPPDEYVADDARRAYSTGGTIASLQVDAGGGPTWRATELNNAFYVYSDTVRPVSCDNIPYGTETYGEVVWAHTDPSFGGCIGRYWTTYDQPGVQGGGYSMQMTNGCNCEAPLIPTTFTAAGMTLTRGSIDYTATCYTVPPTGSGESHAST